MKLLLPSALLVIFPMLLMGSSIQPIRLLESIKQPKALGLLKSANDDLMAGDEPDDKNNRAGFDSKAALDDKSSDEVSSDSWAKLQISPDNIGSMNYGNFRINVYEHSGNQRKALASATSSSPTKPLHNNKYYYAPITLMDHESATSSFNNVTNQAELQFRIEFWNDDVQNRVVDWIREGYDTTVNGKFVEVIPFNKMSLTSASGSFQRRYKMTRDAPYGQQRSVWFKVACATIDDCHKLSANMRDNSAQFSDFRLLFSLDSERAQTRQTIVKVDSILSGDLASRLDQQITGETALLTSKDEQTFLQESATNILLETFDDSDVPARDSQENVMKFIRDNLLAPSKIVLRNAEDKMWNSVFMNEDNYRPDLTTKTMNDIFSKLNTEEQRKLTDTFKNTNKVSVGGSVGVPGIVEVKTQIDTDLSREGSTSTESMDKFLQEMKDNAQWDGAKFVPKPMSLTRVNMGKLRDSQTFQDRSVRVRYSTAVLAVSVNIADHADLASTNRLMEFQRQLEERPTSLAVSNMIKKMISENKPQAPSSVDISALTKPSCYKAGQKPSTCRDLMCHGHRASGYYSVKSGDGQGMETIFCDFNSLTDPAESLIGSLQVFSRAVHFYVQRNKKFDNKPLAGTAGIAAFVLGGPTTVNYQVERLNEGQGMNLESGIFTAPKSGIYSFAFGCLKPDFPPNLDVSLQVNNAHVTMANSNQLDGTSKSFVTVSLAATLRLRAGDKVAIVVKTGMIYEDGNHFTYFSGSLLHEDIVLSQ